MNAYSDNHQLNSIVNLVKSRKYSLALKGIEEYIRKFPKDDYGLYQYGNVLRILKETDEAKEIFEGIIERKKSQKAVGQAYFGLAKIYYCKDLNNLEKVIHYCNKAIQYGFNYNSMLCLIDIYNHINQYDKALKIAMSPVNKEFENRFQLEEANIYYLMGEIELAKEKLEKIVPENDDIKRRKMGLYGKIELKKGNYQEAFEYFNKARIGSRSRFYYEIELRSVSALIQLGKLEDAIRKCHSVIKEYPSLTESVYLTLGEIYQVKREYEKAKNYFEQVKNPVCQNRKNHKLGIFYIETRNFPKAEEYFNKIDDSTTWKLHSQYFLAIIAFKEGRLEDSLTLLSNVDLQNETKCVRDRAYRMKIYLQKQLDLPMNILDISYDVEQIISYQEEKALEHIKDRHVKQENCISRFHEDINVDQLFLEMKESIKERKSGGIDYLDEYIIPYPNIGYSDTGILLHELKIVAMPNTTNIITMYPYKKGLEGTLELRQEEKEPERKEEKVKRKSQIEKFYERYGRK